MGRNREQVHQVSIVLENMVDAVTAFAKEETRVLFRGE